MISAAEALKDFQKITPKTIPLVEPFSKGHRACQGCGEVLALRMVAKAVGHGHDRGQRHRLHGDHILILPDRLGNPLDSRGL